MLSRVLALREKVLTLEHPDTLQSMNNLAGVLSARQARGGGDAVQGNIKYTFFSISI